jgi:hypothetical protein
VIEPEIVELLESPCAQIVGTVDDDGLPDASRGWGALVHDDGRRIRLLVASNAATTIRNLRTTGRIAFTATQFLTLRSVQVKGIAVAVEDPDEDDRARFTQFCAGCARALHEIDDTPEELVSRMVPSDVVACVMTVDELFDQTPGPGAGTRLASSKVQ